MKKSRRIVPAVLFAPIMVFLALTAAIGAELVINFNDGSSVSYDTTKIRAIIFSDTAGAPSAAPQGDVLFEEEFQSELSSMWEPISVAGGDYKQFARVGAGKLQVAVPAGHSWGKTGIMSREPFFTVDQAMDASPLKIVFNFDPAATTGYVIALSTARNADVWWASPIWFHWSRTSALNANNYLLVKQGEEDRTEKVTSSRAPKTVTLSIYPQRVDVSTSEGVQLSSKKCAHLKPGQPVYLYIFSHPWNEGNPAGFSLDSIKVLR